MKFDIFINDVPKEADFDLIDQAGGTYIGLWRDYPNITPTVFGEITVRIAPKLTWNQTAQADRYSATLSGIKVTAQPPSGWFTLSGQLDYYAGGMVVPGVTVVLSGDAT